MSDDPLTDDEKSRLERLEDTVIENEKRSGALAWAYLGVEVIKIFKLPITVALIAIFAFLGINGRLPLPSIPPHIWRLMVQVAIAVGVCYYPAKEAAEYIDVDNRQIVHALEHTTGDFAIARVPQEIWQDVTVVDKRGEEVPKDWLYSVSAASGKHAYEVQSFDLEENEVTVSFMAGFSPTEVRRYQLAVKRIQEERNAKAAKFEDLTANLDTVKHDAVAREINKYIHVVSGLLSMDETSTTESINWASEKHGLSGIDEIDQMIEDAVQTSDPRETYGGAGSGRSRSSMAASYNDAAQGGEGR